MGEGKGYYFCPECKAEITPTFEGLCEECGHPAWSIEPREEDLVGAYIDVCNERSALRGDLAAAESQLAAAKAENETVRQLLTKRFDRYSEAESLAFMASNTIDCFDLLGDLSEKLLREADSDHSEIDSLTAERDKYKAIVDKLPTFKDGSPAVIGDAAFHPDSEQALRVCWNDIGEHTEALEDSPPYRIWHIRDCYSTREARLSGRQAASKEQE